MRQVITILTCLSVGFGSGWYFKEGDEVKIKKEIEYKTVYVKTPPNTDNKNKTIAFYSMCYNSPLHITSTINHNWMTIYAYDGCKTAKKEIELVSVSTTDWKLVLGIGTGCLVAGCLIAMVF